MSRLRRSIVPLLLTVVVCGGASTGPAFADTEAPATSTTAEPTTGEPIPAEPTTPVEPVAADPAPDSVDLTISVTFGKSEFFVDEQVTAQARVTNNGTTAATGVHVDSTGNLENGNWVPSSPAGPVAPGQTVEFGLSSPIWVMVDLVTLSVTARSEEPDANPADNTATVTAPVKVQRGDYQGIVYGDRNRNTVMDTGEALAGLKVVVTGGSPTVVETATTDSTGRFTFRDLSRGHYRISFDTVEWRFEDSTVYVDGLDGPDVVFGGTQWVARILAAEARFDQPSYRLGDTAQLSLILTNTGGNPVPGVTAVCESSTETPPDFGDLVGMGVTVPAHSTWTISVPIPIDARAVDGGAQEVRCTFSAPPDSHGFASVRAIARVPGARAARITGQVVKSFRPPDEVPRWGPPIPNVKVYLRDQVTGAVIVRAISDYRGDFEFRDVPVGVHDLRVVGPYVIVGDTEMHVRASESGSSRLVILWSGPDQPDPDLQPVPSPQPEDPPVPTPPAAGPGPRTELASTGANVTWLALGGLLTLLAGLGLVTRTGRRGTPWNGGGTPKG